MVLLILASFIPHPGGHVHRVHRALGRSSRSRSIDIVVVGFILKRKLGAKFGEDKVERIRWYAAMRGLQLRRLRLPKPQVKRGAFPS